MDGGADSVLQREMGRDEETDRVRMEAVSREGGMTGGIGSVWRKVKDNSEMDGKTRAAHKQSRSSFHV